MSVAADPLVRAEAVTWAARDGRAGDIILFNDVAVVFKRMGDVLAIVTGSQDENEIILHTVLQAFCEALTILLRCVACAVARDTRDVVPAARRDRNGIRECRHSSHEV